MCMSMYGRDIYKHIWVNQGVYIDIFCLVNGLSCSVHA